MNIYFKFLSDENLILPIGDLLHLWKALWGCFQIHPMIIFECSILQKPYVNSYAITISERQYLIIMLNSQNFLIFLIFSSDFIWTDAVGTHLVENSIGIARQTSNDPRWERIFTLFYHSEIRKSIACSKQVER